MPWYRVKANKLTRPLRAWFPLSILPYVLSYLVGLNLPLPLLSDVHPASFFRAHPLQKGLEGGAHHNPLSCPFPSKSSTTWIQKLRYDSSDFSITAVRISNTIHDITKRMSWVCCHADLLCMSPNNGGAICIPSQMLMLLQDLARQWDAPRCPRSRTQTRLMSYLLDTVHCTSIMSRSTLFHEAIPPTLKFSLPPSVNERSHGVDSNTLLSTVCGIFLLK